MTKSKGVRAKNKELTELMKADRNNGMSWDDLSAKYHFDRANIRKRVLGVKRKPQVEHTIKWACHNKW